jgi:hypothetical protein
VGPHLYIAMELVEGTSLLDYLQGLEQKGRRMPEPDIWQVLIAVTLALNYIHGAKKVVHRDLTPGNIVLGQGPEGLRHAKVRRAAGPPRMLAGVLDCRCRGRAALPHGMRSRVRRRSRAVAGACTDPSLASSRISDLPPRTPARPARVARHAPQIADFGLAKRLSSSVVVQSMVGTMPYTCPEIIQQVRGPPDTADRAGAQPSREAALGCTRAQLRHVALADPGLCLLQEPYSEKADVWSLGCVTYHMMMLRPPFDGTNPLSVAHRIVEGAYDPPADPPAASGAAPYSPQLKQLVRLLMTVDPSKCGRGGAGARGRLRLGECQPPLRPPAPQAAQHLGGGCHHLQPAVRQPGARGRDGAAPEQGFAGCGAGRARGRAAHRGRASPWGRPSQMERTALQQHRRLVSAGSGTAGLAAGPDAFAAVGSPLRAIASSRRTSAAQAQAGAAAQAEGPHGGSSAVAGPSGANGSPRVGCVPHDAVWLCCTGRRMRVCSPLLPCACAAQGRARADRQPRWRRRSLRSRRRRRGLPAGRAWAWLAAHRDPRQQPAEARDRPAGADPHAAAQGKAIQLIGRRRTWSVAVSQAAPLWQGPALTPRPSTRGLTGHVAGATATRASPRPSPESGRVVSPTPLRSRCALHQAYWARLQGSVTCCAVTAMPLAPGSRAGSHAGSIKASLAKLHAGHGDLVTDATGRPIDFGSVPLAPGEAEGGMASGAAGGAGAGGQGAASGAAGAGASVSATGVSSEGHLTYEQLGGVLESLLLDRGYYSPCPGGGQAGVPGVISEGELLDQLPLPNFNATSAVGPGGTSTARPAATVVASGVVGLPPLAGGRNR